MNSVFFIGAGPGDPDLLTLQGAKALDAVGVVYLSSPYDKTFAELLQGKQVLNPHEYHFEELVDSIERQLCKESVGFLVPGDLTFYSPYQVLVDHFAERSVVLAGVGVANEASARLKRTLDLPSVCNRTLIISPKILGEGDERLQLEKLAGPGVTLVIYMNNLPLGELVGKLLTGYGKDVPIALLHRLGFPDEKIIEGSLTTIVTACRGVDYFFLDQPEKKPALTLVIVGESLRAETDGNWWNQRCDRNLNEHLQAGGRSD